MHNELYTQSILVLTFFISSFFIVEYDDSRPDSNTENPYLLALGQS
jgi:hypothetical protein